LATSATRSIADHRNRTERALCRSCPHGAAALVGGGIVFALALVLPGLVSLRGFCAVYLAVREDG